MLNPLRRSVALEVEPASGAGTPQKETGAAERGVSAARVTTAVMAEHRPEHSQGGRNLLTTDAPHQGLPRQEFSRTESVSENSFPGIGIRGFR